MTEATSERGHVGSSRPHWPALDGLRGVAVLAVMLFHAFAGQFPNGFAGVDVFFGLSGFLITALLLHEFGQHRRVGLKEFYVRRLLRLYPALVATVGLTLLLAIPAGRLAEFWPTALAVLLYMAHVWIYTGHDAWLLEHTWTLSLEEHYYLLWPPILLCFLKGRRWVWVGMALAAAVIAMLGTSLIVPEGVQAAYSRGTPMIVGSLAAVMWSRWVPRRAGASTASWSWAANVGLLVVVALLFWPNPLPQDWLSGTSSLPGVLAVAIVSGFVTRPQSLSARVLTARIARWFGRRAYGLYLYHLPILGVVMHQGPSGVPLWGRAGLGLLLSIVVAAASYRFIELPFLRMKHRFTPTEGTALSGMTSQDPTPATKSQP